MILSIFKNENKYITKKDGTMIYNDNRFMEIAKPILEHKEYEAMRHIKHHDESVYDHSLKVAYYAYKRAYKSDLDWASTIRGALLHDFFLYKFKKRRSPRLITDSIKHAINHPKIALVNAKKHFVLNEKEENSLRKKISPDNRTYFIMYLLTIQVLEHQQDKHLHKIHNLYMNLHLFHICHHLLKYIQLDIQLHKLRKIYNRQKFYKPLLKHLLHINIITVSFYTIKEVNTSVKLRDNNICIIGFKNIRNRGY
jgi:uncharacterized protein